MRDAKTVSKTRTREAGMAVAVSSFGLLVLVVLITSIAGAAAPV